MARKRNPSFLEADFAKVAIWSCHLRFDEMDTPKAEMVDEGVKILLSNERMGVAGRILFEKRESCVFRELN